MTAMRDIAHENCVRVYEEMYFGSKDGRAAMMVRVDRLEKCVAEIVENSRTIRNMMLATMFTVIGGVFSMLLSHFIGI